MSNQNPISLENVIKSVIDFIAMVNIGIAISVWNGINQASRDIIQIREQVSSIRAEVSLIRVDVAKSTEIQNSDIKVVQQKLARLEATIPATKP